MAESPFVFEEQGANGTRVELKGSDMPFGRPRKHAAFDVGGELETREVFLQGREDPIVHVDQPRNAPLVIRGHFRDNLFGENGHALEMKRAITKIWKRARTLNISWGPFKWEGYLKHPKLGVESDADITYDIEFRIFRETTDQASVSTRKIESSPADLAAQIRALLAERRAASLIEFLTVETVIAMREVFDTVEKAMQDVETAAVTFANSGAQATDQARGLITKAEQAKQATAELLDLLETLDASSALTTTDLGPTAELWLFQHDGVLDCHEAIDGMRTLQETALLSVRDPDRLYQVAPGDTPEKIARTQLGNPALADKLAVRPQDLKPGSYIRLPRSA